MRHADDYSFIPGSKIEELKSQNDTKLYRWKSVYPSWYPAPVLTLNELTYLKLIEKIFKVIYPDGKWDYIKLTNHQAEFHKKDLAIKKFNAKNRVVVKSRGTSFTTDSLISLCMNCYEFRDQLPPIVRINDTKVMELLQKDFKNLINHMTPLRMEYEDENGNQVIDYIPFNNKTVEFTAHSIKIPDRNITFVGYPANSTSSENIRGNRINFGLMDETNFIVSFQNIDTAMRDATRGAALDGPNKGKIAYQATYGTTRKGKYTSFNIWLDNIKKLINSGLLNNFEIIEWPALDPNKVDLNKPLTEQPELIPIAPWQTLEILEQRRVENLNIFKEEYMAMLVDDLGMLYDMKFINENLILDDNIKSEMFIPIEELKRMQEEEQTTKWWIGMDPAYSQDFFAISIFKEVFDKNINNTSFIQTCIDYKRDVDLDEMQDLADKLIEHYMPYGLKLLQIDGHGLGTHISNHVRKKYPEHSRLFRNTSIRVPGKTAGSISIKEFVHTHQIMMQYAKRVKYLADPIQLMHFSGWNQKYEFERVKDASALDMAHGDTTISNGLAILPKNLNYMFGSNAPTVGNALTTKKLFSNIESSDTVNAETITENLKNITIDDKLKMYKKIKFSGGGLF